MINNTTIAVNRDCKMRAAKKLKNKGIPLSVAINMFFNKLANDEIDIDFINKNELRNDFYAKDIPVTDRKTAKLMDEVGQLYSNI